MEKRNLEIVLSTRVYPKKAVDMAIDAFKDFIEVIPRQSSFNRVKYEMKVYMEVNKDEIIAEFLNFALGCVKNI